MSPIPKGVLPDTILINTKEFKYVRVEQIDKLVNTEYGLKHEKDYLLFVDRVNTLDFDELVLELKENQMVKYEDKHLRVFRVDVLKDQNEIHHLEVYLR